MKRPLLFITVFLICAGIGVLLLRNQHESSPPPIGEQPARVKASSESGPLKDVLDSQASIDAGIETVAMKASAYSPNTEEAARLAKNPPFQFIGNDADGRVLDKQGKVLIESGDEVRILGIAVGPDRQRVLIHGGSAINYALEPNTGAKVKLPEKPPGVDVFGFGQWYWIGEHSLLGVSGIQAFDAKGKAVKCCEGHDVAKITLFVFDLVSGKLTAVQTPKEVNHPVFTVMEAAPDGHIKLLYEEPHGGSEQELGWFKIDAEPNK
jgi:hypothetical protein